MVKRIYKTRFKFLLLGMLAFGVFGSISIATLVSLSTIKNDVKLITNHEIPLTKVFDNVVDLLVKNSRTITELSRSVTQRDELENSGTLNIVKVRNEIDENNQKIKQELDKGKVIITGQQFNDEQRRYAFLSLLTLEDSLRDIGITTNQVLKRIEKGEFDSVEEMINDLFSLNNTLNDNLLYFSDEIDAIIASSSASLERDISNILYYNYLVIFLFLLISFFVFIYVYRFILYPMDKAIEGIEAISRGDRTFSFAKSISSTGLGNLMKKLKSMLDSVNDYETQLRREKEKAEESERLKTQFLSSMSHEIRTPLNTIIGTSEILEECNITGDQRKLVASIASASNNLLDIINKILDISKIEAGQFELHEEIFEPRIMIEDVVQIFKIKAEEKKISLLMSVDESVPRYVEGSAIHIRQILINLVSNSLKFTEKGYVKIHLERMSGEEYLFSIKDTGIGINQKFIPKLFKPFSQQDSSIFANFGGTGLGLSFCQKVLGLMNSKMEVITNEGEGSTFTFAIKLKNIAQLKQSFKEEVDYISKINESSGLRILVVDDAEDNLNLLKLYFSKLNLNVEYCRNGKEALEQYMLNPFDVVVMDVQMPIMNGNDAIFQIRNHERERGLRKSHIISLTAHAISSEREKCFAAGCDEYLAKPVKKNMLFEKIYEGIEKELPTQSMKVH